MKYDIDSIKSRKQKAKKIKNVIDIMLVILIYNIVLIVILCMNRIEPISIFGYKAYIITTNSMKPLLTEGDIIIVKQVEEKELKQGDVITFYQSGEVITHRITNIEEGQIKKYITKGDNNNVEDIEKVQYSDIEGKYIVDIPNIGMIFKFLENRIVFLIIILTILILEFYKISINEKKEIRKEKKRIENEKNIGKQNI